MAAGGPLFGALSDRRGRRTALYCSGATAAASCALSAVCGRSFWSFFFFRTLSAVAVQGMATANIVLVTESVGPSYRGRVGTISQVRSTEVSSNKLFQMLKKFILLWLFVDILRRWRVPAGPPCFPHPRLESAHSGLCLRMCNIPLDLARRPRITSVAGSQREGGRGNGDTQRHGIEEQETDATRRANTSS